MDALEHLRQMLAYDDWADRELMAAVKASGSEPATRLYAHLVATHLLWIDRMAHKPPRCAFWPEWNLEECARRLDEVGAAWRNFTRGLDVRALDTTISYVNTKGKHFHSRVGDVVTHVLLHSAHHRGQIAALVRAQGGAPPAIDYIHAVREGCLASGGD